MMMWAHYANNHQGLVFQFRKSFLHDAVSKEFRGKEVEYTPDAVGVQEYVDCLEKGIDHGDAMAMASIIYATKTKHWEQEEEVRFFSEGKNKFLSFPEDALAGIIFGDKCDEDCINKVAKSTKKWERPPRIYQTSIANSTHKLWIKKI